MSKFEKYLKKLADHEDKKSKPYLKDPRDRILVNAGIRLNWLGDFFANTEIEWEELELPVEKIQFTGTSPEWNEILTNQCKRSVLEFRKLIGKNPKIKRKFEQEAFCGNEIILVRKSEDEGFYKVLDGMHRFVGKVLEGKDNIKAWCPVNEDECLPICEAHVVYDLIRGFQRNARDKEGEIELYYALKFLSRTYANIPYLLRDRFNENYVHDDKVQEIIKRVLEED